MPLFKLQVLQAEMFWQNVLRVRRNDAVIRLTRGCETSTYFPNPTRNGTAYCKLGCAKKMEVCGEFEIPEEHLEPCRFCDAIGRNCQTVAGTGGPGIQGHDFVLYVTALHRGSCVSKSGDIVSAARFLVNQVEPGGGSSHTPKYPPSSLK